MSCGPVAVTIGVAKPLHRAAYTSRVIRTEQEREAIREELERVLSTAAFVRNQRQSRFLRFLVERHLEGKDSELKESVIAVEVFGRQADYDPKLDAIVRTEAVRLRARLERYYAAEGSADRLIIELPKGGYRPVFRDRPATELTPAPVAAELQPEPVRQERPSRWTWWLAGALAVVTVAVAGASWWRRPNPVTFTVAVLPLENLNHDPASEYFADGLTDEIIRNLSIIDGLTVRSRTSSFAFKGKRVSAADAGRQLEADYLVEGSVLQAGEQLRVNAELVRVRDDSPLWSNRFDRELNDVFAIQDEISRGIVNSLRMKLAPGRQRYETNLEAYDLYLRGRQAMEGFPAQGRNIAVRAVQYFEGAIEKDANYAIAYAGMADAFRAIDQNTVNPEAYARAKVAAEKAVTLDPMLSEAQSALASIRARDYEWEDAEHGFRRALELNPNNALAHLDLGFSVLVLKGHFDEGLDQVRRAAALDPLSPYINTEFGRALLWSGRYSEAVDQLRKAIALDPSRNRPYLILELTLSLQGKTAEALTLLEEAGRRGAQLAERPGIGQSCILALTGRRQEALAVLKRQLAGSRADSFPDRRRSDPDAPLAKALVAARSGTSAAREVAQIYACLGDEDHALDYLEKALNQHEPGLAEMIQSPELAWMRSDPRFVRLRKAVNLTP